jgi:hypothetical protein
VNRKSRNWQETYVGAWAFGFDNIHEIDFVNDDGGGSDGANVENEKEYGEQQVIDDEKDDRADQQSCNHHRDHSLGSLGTSNEFWKLLA